MINTSSIKFKLLNILPKNVFDAIYKLWLKYGIKVVEYFKRRKLRKFTHPIFKTVQYDGQQFSILIDNKNGVVDNEIFLSGCYEPFFLSLIKKNLNKGDVFVDIGANIGQHSLFASGVVGDEGKVIAFEPIPRTYDQFSRSVQKNSMKNVEIHNCGCGEAESTLEIFFEEGNISGSSFIKSDDKDLKESISIVKADSILMKEKKISFIKIDVEGFELEVLKGLQQTINKYHPIILIEYSPYYFDISDPNIGFEIISILVDSGYNLYDLEFKKTVQKTKEDFNYYKENNIRQTNFLCTPKSV